MPLPKPMQELASVLPSDVRQSFSFPSAYTLAEQRRAYYFLGSDYLYMALNQFESQIVQAEVMDPDGTVGIAGMDGAINVNMNSVDVIEAVAKRHPAIFKAAERKFRAQAVYWQKRKLSLLSIGGATHEKRYQNLLEYAYDIELLAICYDRAGDKAGRDRTLRRLIQECQALPQRGGLLRRQDEYVLRTGQFPGDADYKGRD